MKKKRLFDLILGICIFGLISPLILFFSILIFCYDRSSPLFISLRIGKNGEKFKIYKIRTMVINADKLGGTSTKKSDKRLLPMGNLIRKLKLDELTQIINVINGSMSFVGPRPNTPFDVNLYSNKEKILLSIKPGITDFSSIVFADEGDILDAYDDPDLAYNQLIRPWKSKLGLFYIKHSCLKLDMQLIVLTILNSISRKKTLNIISSIIKKYKGSTELIEISKRRLKLVPSSPPGFNHPIQKIYN